MGAQVAQSGEGKIKRHHVAAGAQQLARDAADAASGVEDALARAGAEAREHGFILDPPLVTQAAVRFEGEDTLAAFALAALQLVHGGVSMRWGRIAKA